MSYHVCNYVVYGIEINRDTAIVIDNYFRKNVVDYDNDFDAIYTGLNIPLNVDEEIIFGAQNVHSAIHNSRGIEPDERYDDYVFGFSIGEYYNNKDRKALERQYEKYVTLFDTYLQPVLNACNIDIKPEIVLFDQTL